MNNMKMPNQIATVSASRAKPAGKKHVESFTVTKAGNGFTSETRFKDDDDKGNGPIYHQPELNVHKSVNEAARLMKNCMGSGMGKDAGAKHEKMEGKASEKDEEGED